MKQLLAIAILAASSIGAVPALARGGAEQTSVFHVEGMTCALCSKAIDKALRGLEGVRSVEVDRKAAQVTVVVDAAIASDRLEQAIESAGRFQAELVR